MSAFPHGDDLHPHIHLGFDPQHQYPGWLHPEVPDVESSGGGLPVVDLPSTAKVSFGANIGREAMGKMLVFSNPVEGRDDEYNKWYDEVHMKDLLGVSPFKSAERFRVAQVQGLPEGSHRYLAVYEFDGPPQTALDNMFAAAGNFQMSDALSAGDALIVFVEDY
jgi:hypothetical protein